MVSRFLERRDREIQNEELDRSGALLLAAKHIRASLKRGPDVGGAYADKVNRMPKYVASKTLKAVDWSGAELLRSGMPRPSPNSRTPAEMTSLSMEHLAGARASKVRACRSDQSSRLPSRFGARRTVFEDGHECKLDCVSATRFSSGVLALDLRPKL